MAWSALVCTFSGTCGCGWSSSRAINADDVLVVLTDLNHHARLVPLSGVWAGLVLESHMMANYKGWKSLCVFRPSLGSFHVTDSQSFLSWGQDVTPGRMWLVSPRQDKYTVLDRPAKNAQCRGELRIRIGCISVLEDGTSVSGESVSRLPFGVVLSVMIRLTVFTTIYALQFECGNATDDRRWCTPHSFKNWRVVAAVNSGPPSVAHSSGMPKVASVRRKQSMSPLDPSCARSTVGQLE